jgi:hypothetical protein
MSLKNGQLLAATDQDSLVDMYLVAEKLDIDRHRKQLSTKQNPTTKSKHGDRNKLNADAHQ